MPRVCLRLRQIKRNAWISSVLPRMAPGNAGSPNVTSFAAIVRRQTDHDEFHGDPLADARLLALGPGGGHRRQRPLGRLTENPRLTRRCGGRHCLGHRIVLGAGSRVATLR